MIMQCLVARGKYRPYFLNDPFIITPFASNNVLELKILFSPSTLALAKIFIALITMHMLCELSSKIFRVYTAL